MSAIQTDQHIKAIFRSYQRANLGLGFPGVGTLGDWLNSQAQLAISKKQDTFSADQKTVRMFASAAIEMWHRSLHSFIVSAGLSTTSAIWSSVAGYYASHYVMRSYAHLLGRYVLYRHPRIVALGVQGGGFYCLLEGKKGNDREHKAYRKFVHESAAFGKDPFFWIENESLPQSDTAHRNKANYYDHVSGFSGFKALDLDATVERIQRISAIEITALPVPDAGKFPDLENVQIVAYHRIVRFRKYLDSLLGDENKFWNAHRSPTWCTGILDFQIVDPQFLPGSVPS